MVFEERYFFGVALIAVPTFVALSWIRPQDIAYGRAHNASGRNEAGDLQRIRDLLKSQGLLTFATAAILFRLADASMLPLVSEDLGSRRESLSALLMAGTIIVPQFIVAVVAPWVGHYAEQWGRKPILLIGFGSEPIRGALFAVLQLSLFMHPPTSF